MDNRKKNLLNSNISSLFPHNMVKVIVLTAEICRRVSGTPANFNWFLALAWLLHRRDSMKVNKTLQNVSPSPGLVHCLDIYGGSCPLKEFCQLQTSLCFQVFRSVLAALLHGTRLVAVSQTLWQARTNGITELSQTALPILGWAAITLGIGPHSS